MARQTELMRDLGETLRVSSVRPLVVITGDHAPPFGNVGDRAAFSAKRVPVLILRPLS
jgi:2,3-bisphosphoglycerate-independent phosphoglycerate mutase